MIMGMGCLFFLLIAVVLIGGGAWLVATLTRDSQARPAGPGQTSTLDVLKMRYAKGEISKEQFEGLRRDLGV
ncbi:MAG TPA: SHOCT domain-containing protein [Anaerolineae bacterium]